MTTEQWATYFLTRQQVIDVFVGTSEKEGLNLPHTDLDNIAPESIIFDPRDGSYLTLADLPEVEAYDDGTRFLMRDFDARPPLVPARGIKFRMRKEAA